MVGEKGGDMATQDHTNPSELLSDLEKTYKMIQLPLVPILNKHSIMILKVENKHWHNTINQV
jgi:hypothetical protein